MGVCEARTKFSSLLKRVANGETITVTRRGRDVAKIVPARVHGGFDWEGFESLGREIATQNKGKGRFDYKEALERGRKY